MGETALSITQAIFSFPRSKSGKVHMLFYVWKRGKFESDARTSNILFKFKFTSLSNFSEAIKHV